MCRDSSTAAFSPWRDNATSKYRSSQMSCLQRFGQRLWIGKVTPADVDEDCAGLQLRKCVAIHQPPRFRRGGTMQRQNIAAPRCPVCNASVNASGSARSPRLTLMKIAPGFSFANVSRFINRRVFAVEGQCNVKISQLPDVLFATLRSTPLDRQGHPG